MPTKSTTKTQRSTSDDDMPPPGSEQSVLDEARSTLSHARESVESSARQAVSQAKGRLETVSGYAQERPLLTIGVAFVVGYFLGRTGMLRPLLAAAVGAAGKALANELVTNKQGA